MFHRPKDSVGQVHVELRRPMEPAIVRQINEHIRRAIVAVIGEKPGDHLRNRILETNGDRQDVIAQTQTTRIVAEAETGHPLAVIGCQDRQPGQHVNERDIFSKRNEMHLVVKIDP